MEIIFLTLLDGSLTSSFPESGTRGTGLIFITQWGMTSREAGVRGVVSKAGKEREPVQFIGNCDLRTKALIRFPILPKLLHEIHTEYLKEAGPLEEISGFLINQN